MQFCDFKTLSTRVLNEFSDVASATKLGRLFQILVTLLVKVKLCRFFPVYHVLCDAYFLGGHTKHRKGQLKRTQRNTGKQGSQTLYISKP